MVEPDEAVCFGLNSFLSLYYLPKKDLTRLCRGYNTLTWNSAHMASCSGRGPSTAATYAFREVAMACNQSQLVYRSIIFCELSKLIRSLRNLL